MPCGLRGQTRAGVGQAGCRSALSERGRRRSSCARAERQRMGGRGADLEGARRLPRAVAYDVPPLLQAHQGLIKECKGSRLAKLTSGSARVGSGGTQTPKVGSFCAVVSRLTRHRIGKYCQPASQPGHAVQLAPSKAAGLSSVERVSQVEDSGQSRRAWACTGASQASTAGHPHPVHR
ncbi:hypothetical protein BJY59DRAFT_701227 [Rhodotorula toruloides]